MTGRPFPVMQTARSLVQGKLGSPQAMVRRGSPRTVGVIDARRNVPAAPKSVRPELRRRARISQVLVRGKLRPPLAVDRWAHHERIRERCSPPPPSFRPTPESMQPASVKVHLTTPSWITAWAGTTGSAGVAFEPSCRWRSGLGSSRAWSR